MMDRVQALEEYVKTLEGQIEDSGDAGLRYESTGSYQLTSGDGWTTVPDASLPRITLTAGTWVVSASLVVPADRTGRRALRLYDATNDEGLTLSASNQDATTGAPTRMQTMTTITVEDDTDITCQVAQTSGSRQTVTVGIEAVLIAADAEIPSGSGGVSSYNDLTNKPKIEGVTLQGDKTYEMLNLEYLTNQELEEMLI